MKFILVLNYNKNNLEILKKIFYFLKAPILDLLSCRLDEIFFLNLNLKLLIPFLNS